VEASRKIGANLQGAAPPNKQGQLAEKPGSAKLSQKAGGNAP
jgi:hypothetical protein